MIEKFAVTLVGLSHSFGYLGVFLLMTLESSFFPFPSEVVVPPAGFLSATGKMNIFIVILCGICGSIAGALINYYIAVKFGRVFLIKYGNYLFMGEDKLVKMESYFKKHGEITTFAGRLVPGLRQYISFPAGLARMNLTKFIVYTSLGSGIWVVILAYIGYYVGRNMDLVKEQIGTVTIFLIPLLAVVVLFYIFVNKKNSIKR